MIRHKLQDGDVLKLIPILKKDGSLVPYIKAEYLYLNAKGPIIFDTQKYLHKLKYSEYGRDKNIAVGIRYFISVFVDDKIKLIEVGKSLYELVSSVDFCVNDNKHLLISQKNVIGFIDYKMSSIIEKNWNVPIFDDEKEWIKENQGSYLEDFLDSRSVMSNINILNENYDNFFMDLIAEERDKKLQSLGIMDDEERMFTLKELNDSFLAGREEDLVAPWEVDEGVSGEYKYEEFEDYFNYLKKIK